MRTQEVTLESLIFRAGALQAASKAEVSFGDRVIVETRNSSYEIVSLGEGLYRVTGGWFDQRGLSPATTTINGCTWGGSAIKTDLLAGPGLFLEFGNTVVTSRIRRVRVIRAQTSGWIN